LGYKIKKFTTSKEIKLKILLSTHIGYPWGGISIRYSDLLNSTLPEKVELTFFESSPNIKSFSNTGSCNIRNIFYALSVYAAFITILIKTKPDIVHIATAQGWSFTKNSILILISKLFTPKIIIAPHCSVKIFIPKSQLSKKWMKFILGKCDGLLALSNEWYSITKIAPNISLIVLLNSINLSKYLSIGHGGKDEKVQIIFLGHIGKEKGIYDLLDAMKEIIDKGIHNLELSIYGESLRPGDMELANNRIMELGIEDWVFIKNPVFDQEKIEVYKQADIFVLPSYHEGMPISIIEAMAAGLPIVATNVGGIPDLVENNHNGIIVDVNSPMQLSNAMIKLINDPNLRCSFGIEGRKRAIESHDINIYVNKLVDFYNFVLNK
jgi:glycosyltransferase involved in cell wall biosynthesis